MYLKEELQEHWYKFNKWFRSYSTAEKVTIVFLLLALLSIPPSLYLALHPIDLRNFAQTSITPPDNIGIPNELKQQQAPNAPASSCIPDNSTCRDETGSLQGECCSLQSCPAGKLTKCPVSSVDAKCRVSPPGVIQLSETTGSSPRQIIQYRAGLKCKSKFIYAYVNIGLEIDNTGSIYFKRTRKEKDSNIILYDDAEIIYGTHRYCVHYILYWISPNNAEHQVEKIGDCITIKK